LPGWQHFFQNIPAEANFKLISVACEHGGGENARPYVEAAKTTFPTAIDDSGITAVAFGFKVVPNGLLVDANGIIRYAKYGGFEINHPEDVAAVTRFAAGGDPGPSPASDVPYELSGLELELVATHLRLARVFDSLGRVDEAVGEWQAALRIDPRNFVVRKQIWAARHPEKFHPAIDFAWQAVQLAREREAELAAGICGPDGCPLPRR
jgi:hypothetical protein